MSLDMQPGDLIILASDGLPAVIEEDELAGVIKDATDPVQVCEQLVAHTLEGGAPDNVTVLCIYYDAEETTEATLQPGVTQKESNSVHA
jgi:protein phosphatase